jgi:hypothetical protein
MKPGIRTTEFWVALGVILLAVALAVLQQIPTEWAASAASIVAAVYVVARTVLKLSGRGALVDEAETVRKTVQEEVAFALAEKQKATLPHGERGHALRSALIILGSICIVGSVLLLGAPVVFRSVPETAGGKALSEWIVVVPVVDKRPFWHRLWSSVRFTPAVAVVYSETEGCSVKVEKIELRGGADF